ncbi:carboxypeptidase-like regulatory domain-containing protein [Paraflavisolibacter sp. H34]|uniref:carboxypeptidase-like regulatory domain-containing protein n=1 Tax=Huijunlia imazamoxiresistens TaxID=3127457 RepID=UPI00301AF1D8
MRKKLFYPLAAAALLLLFYTGCQKELNPDLTDPQTEVPETVTASVTGRVLDENGVPVGGAQVITRSGTTLTDINGEFRFNRVALDKEGGFVRVEKAGYFSGSRTFAVTAGSLNYVAIELIPQTQAGTFGAAGGGAVTVPSGGSITFPAQSVINASSRTVYSGEVKVAAFHLNPEAANFNNIMPGSLEGLTTGNEQVALKSFGMMAVELTGSGGEKLQLASGKKATLTFPIPATLQGKAPATIPLWYFDEAAGRWKEEGVATKQGSNYVGTVAHFSFWNCDAPFKVVDFEAVITDQNGPMPFTKVTITEAGDEAQLSGSGYTDSAGRISGMIPANVSLNLSVYNKCGDQVYQDNIGTLSQKKNLGTLRVNNPATSNTYRFSGTLHNCSNAPVASGFVTILLGGQNYRAAVTNGNFSTTITACQAAAQATVAGYDIDGRAYSDTLTLNTASSTPLQLKACNAITVNEFLDFNFNGTRYYFLAPGDSLVAFLAQGITYIDASTRNSNTTALRSVNFKFGGPAATGTRTIYSWSLRLDRQYQSSDSLAASISEYGPAGGYIAGSFSGNLRMDSVATPVPVTGTFRLKRMQ